MSTKRAPKGEITPNRVLHRLHSTDIYTQLMQITVPKGESTNNALLKSLTENSETMRIVIDYAKGETEDLNIALNTFKMKLGLDSGFDRFKDTIEQTFQALVESVKNILGIQAEVAVQVEEVVKADFEVGEMRNLKKGTPMPINRVNQLQVIIERDGEKKNHQLYITYLRGELIISCPTADLKTGKKIQLTIAQGDEYGIGHGNRTLLDRAKAKSSKFIEEKIATQKVYKAHHAISTVSVDTINAKEKLDKLQAEIDLIWDEMYSLEKSPLLQWFNPIKSSDISTDHIIISFEEDGKIVLTDEGKKCSASVRRVA